MTPTRVTLSRAKGWKMPPNTISVARPHRFGNPFTEQAAKEAGYRRDTARFVVECFRNWLAGDRADWSGPESDAKAARLLAALPTLRGKNLACWCKTGPCHADVLLELANHG